MDKQRILIIDDELDIRGLIRLLLEGEGYSVSEAANGQSGLDAIRKSPPDLIITDYMLPDIDGLSVIHQIREAGFQIPSILMTAKGSEEVAVRALRAGITDYLIKPFDADDLRRAVREQLARPEVKAAPPSESSSIDDIRQLGQTAALMIDLDQMLPRVLEAALQLTGTQEGNLMLLDPDTGVLYTRVSRNMDGKLQMMQLKTESSLAGQVISTRKPLLINSQHQQKIKTEYLVNSVLYLPLIASDQVIGVLGLFNRTNRRAISEKDVDTAMTLASEVAAAIQAARQFDDSRQQARKFDALFRNVSDPIIAVDENGRIVMCNPAASSILVRDAKSTAIGQSYKDVLVNADLREMLDPSNREFAQQIEIELADGRIFNAQINQVDGIGRTAVFQNISHLKELDRLKTDLVTQISHDLRSPLTAILSYVELMNRVGQLNDQQLEFSSQAKESVKIITEMVNNLLEIDHLDPDADHLSENINLKDMVEQSIRAVEGKARLKNQTLSFDSPASIPLVTGNPMRLRQVFGNLVDNAIKYTPEGGEVRVRISEQGSQIVVSVSDTGVGIPQDEQSKIFEKGFRASGVAATHEGRGIGLSIVKSVVEAHSGRIWVQSRPGQGTTFTVMLPASTKISA